MPWSASDYPASMKHLSPDERRDAISVANGILESGGDEGMAIATGIARAEGKRKKSTVNQRPQFRDDVLKMAAGDPISPDGEEDTGPHACAGCLTAAAEGELPPPTPTDLNDPTLHIHGYGVMRKSQIEKGIRDRLAEAAQAAQQGNWGKVSYFFTNRVIESMAKTLIQFEETGMYYDNSSDTMKKLESTP